MRKIVELLKENIQMKHLIKLILKEIIPIVAGILIALYINNWNEERKNEKYINQIYSSISKELKDTNEEITAKIPNQKSTIDTLDFYMANNKITLFDIVLKNNGFHTPTIKINSWKAISNSKIELLQYKKMTILADIEDQKNNLNQKLDKLLSFLYPSLNETEKNKKFVMKIMIKDIINTEIKILNLINSYQ